MAKTNETNTILKMEVSEVMFVGEYRVKKVKHKENSESETCVFSVPVNNEASSPKLVRADTSVNERVENDLDVDGTSEVNVALIKESETAVKNLLITQFNQIDGINHNEILVPTVSGSNEDIKKSIEAIASSFNRIEPDLKRFREILLIGEKGAGKMKFINGLFNYIRIDNNFENIEEISLKELSPSCFWMYEAAGEEYKEKNSQTACMRSYDLEFEKKLIRITYTNSFDHTQLLPNKNESIIKEIIHFVKQQHFNKENPIDAVCVALKSKSETLPEFLVRFLRTLVEWKIRNIAFIFNDLTANSYAPGTTLHTIRNQLVSNYLSKDRNGPIDYISAIEKKFSKENIFFFDHQCFEWLREKEKKIKTKKEDDIDDYNIAKRSWEMSRDESKRFYQYIFDDLSHDIYKVYRKS